MNVRMVAKFFFCLFAGLFVLRMAYGYYTTPDVAADGLEFAGPPGLGREFPAVRRNYAAEDSAPGAVAPGVGRRSGERYETIASIVVLTGEYDDCAEKLADMMDRHGAVIQ
ncbi:MAG: hypothetical protein LBQ56_05620, partial [Synergistaceae bacterium]|nr:hypothetical protein [Synergistaceae bacterium]